MKKFKRHLVTSALPYANGPVHIGHLAGVYIPSDIYTRYLRLKGEDVIHVCGTDEHGVPITIKAKQEGVTPQDIVDKYHKIIGDSFKGLGISFDIFSRTTTPTHYATASEFFKKLHDAGKFVEQTSEQYYDEEAKQFLADRYIMGTCPHCGNDRAYGDQCEKCGTSLNSTDLIDPKSMVSGSKPVMRETKHWYLPLDQYQKDLEKWILEDHKEWKNNVYGQCKSWLDLGLQPRAVSRDLDWGIPVPVEGAEGKVLYVWFDAPIGYISATKDLTPDWEKYWKSEDTKMVHFIGKDNIVFHCIVFPAMLMAEGSYNLPENVPANEFLNLEGDKISTSRNWAVWLHEYLHDFPGKEDVLRYVLCANAPETKDNDFTWKDFQTRNNSELVAIFGNFVNRALVLTQKYFGNKVPAAGELTDFDRETLAEMPAIKKAVEDYIEVYRFRDALKEAMNLARLGNKYLADTEPWKVAKTDMERVATILNVALQITANLAIVFEPFLPFSTEKLLKMLNAQEFGWDKLGSTDLLAVGHELGKAELLFEKIEDSVIDAQLKKLEDTKLANALKEYKAEPQKDEAQFDDFMKMDIRVGTITAAEKVAKTKKLLKLTVDTGIDTRTIVSGIAEHFDPEALVGKQACFLVNLAPREIKGITSNGMILMAQDADGKLRLVQPNEAVKPGSQVG
ncbi:methionine--tRNA ligase [uncultured Acetobacteroides sp.]|uniref:methionine--tRNA ligase n=1 Tax=uncultured Acetobacteroides sp. TaxID=1760811 RepID=UPI0029F55A2D|nr:methionine--tRNA ligase [uncultured Acetobacteroides sp.]